MATTTDPMVRDEVSSHVGPSERTVRFVAVRADLMPPEVATSRAADRTRRNVLVGLATVLAVLALAFAGSWWQTHSARSELAGLQAKGAALNGQTQKYEPLVLAQSRTAAIHTQLAQLMSGDLSWRDLLIKLRAAAPAGTTITQITGSVTDAASAPAATPGAATATQAGTLTLTGTSRSKADVATYADTLATVKGLASATPTSVTAGSAGTGATAHGAGVTFSMGIVITSQALGGRFAAPAPSANGASSATSTGGH